MTIMASLTRVRVAVNTICWAVWVALLFAVFDAGLLQWTSHFLPAWTTVYAFGMSAAVCLMVALGALSIGTVVALLSEAEWWPTAEMPKRLRIGFTVLGADAAARLESFILLAVFAFYNLSRARMADNSLAGVLLVTAAIGGGIVLLALFPGAARACGKRILAIVAATASAFVWSALADLRVEPLLPLMLITTAGFLLIVWFHSGLEERVPIAARGYGTLGLLVVSFLFSAITYPIRPGIPAPLERDLELRREHGSDGESAAAASVFSSDGSGRLDDQRPNVVVIVLDTVRADHLSLYGYGRPTTPHLERLAKSATVYEMAISNASWSLPAHASLLTGLLPHQHGAHTVILDERAGGRSGAAGSQREGSGEAGDRPRGPSEEDVLVLAQQALAEDHSTLAELLGELGYGTAAVVANHAWFSEPFGLLQGIRYVHNAPNGIVSVEVVAAPFLRRFGSRRLVRLYDRVFRNMAPSEKIVERVVRWREDVTDRPYFLLVNFMDAHSPYIGATVDVPGFPLLQESESAVDAYDRSIAYLDVQVGRLLDWLEDRGDLERTLLVITSDHGEGFPEDGHGVAEHGTSLHQSQIRVPLIVRWPFQRTGSRVSTPVQLVDIVPTVLQAVGLENPKATWGVNLESARSSRAIVAENYFRAIGGIRDRAHVSADHLHEERPSSWSLIEGDWKLISVSNGEQQLYDLSLDPNEQMDRSMRQPAVASRLEQTLRELLPPEALRPETMIRGSIIDDPEVWERLRSLGYVR